MSRALSRISGHAIILLYHRVKYLNSDPQWLAVRPDNFEEHLAVLRSNYRLISLSHLAESLLNGKIPPKSVVVTFDDGYADNLQNAKPLLESFDVPATVFVVTNQIEAQAELWWDELEALLMTPVRVPEELTLRIDQHEFKWDLEPEAAEEFISGLKETWNLTMSIDPSPRHTIYRELSTMLKDATEECREAVLDDLAHWAGVSRQIRDSHRTLTAKEIVDLAENGLVEIGAHTVSHPVLATQSSDDQFRELSESKRQLEKILSRPVETTSYPYGDKGDYGTQTVRLAELAGFNCACSNFPGRILKATNRYELPRHIVRDWDAETFARHMEKWSDG